jgi:CheY-like chemotaxis protein
MTRILLVDDMRTVLLLEEMLMHSAGFETETASNGKEALESVKRSPPDLVVLDVAMPVMNGIETCRILKANPTTKHIPVVMLTTMGEKTSMEDARVAGCDGYVTKPVQKNELIKKIKALLAKKP